MDMNWNKRQIGPTFLPAWCRYPRVKYQQKKKAVIEPLNSIIFHLRLLLTSIECSRLILRQIDSFHPFTSTLRPPTLFLHLLKHFEEVGGAIAGVKGGQGVSHGSVFHHDRSPP